MVSEVIKILYTSAHSRESGNPEQMSFYVYILANFCNGTLYVGMTDDLARRIFEHQTGIIPGFTKKHNLKMLVWYEVHESRETAFQRERQIKKWNRAWKLELIEATNPNWKDLTDELNM
jgi:putative endonuclease